MKTSAKLVILFLFTITITAYAQKSDYKNDPGFVDFGDLSQFQTGQKINEVTLSEDMIKMTAGLAQNNEHASKLISGLKFVNISSFEINGKYKSQLRNKIKSLDNELTNKSWSRIVDSKTANESASIYIKTGQNNEIIGLVVTCIEKDGEAAFANIIGNIDLDSVRLLSQKFNFHMLKLFWNKYKARQL